MASSAVEAIVPSRLQPAAFQNAGNSCFINSTIAALFANNSVSEYLFANRNPLSRLSNTFHSSVGAKKYVVRPREYLDPPFYTGRQRDAQEFLSEMLSTDVDQTAQSKFLGYAQTRLRCLQCGCARPSAQVDPFALLSLPVIKADLSVIRSVQEAVDSYFKEEVVFDFTDWVCDDVECPHDRGMGKTLNYILWPKVLAVQLMRWSTDLKLGHHVHANDNITVNGQTYVLRSVVCHAGSGTQVGHYYTFAK